MEFWQHLRAANEADLQGVTEGLASRFSELTSRGHSVADLIAHYGDEFGHLPPERLRGLAHAHRQWQLWRRRRAQIEQARVAAKLGPLPEAVFTNAPRPDQLDAIVRTARLEPRPLGDDRLPEWIAILGGGVELWTRCMARTRKSGCVRSRAKDLEHAATEASEFDAYVRLEEPLDGLAPHRWLAMRRGERVGVLELSLEIPEEALAGEVKLMQPRLGGAAAARTPESLLQELILDDLRPWLLRILDAEAQTLAIRAATDALAGLLRSQPVQVRVLGAVHLTKAKAPVASVVLDREGDIVAQRVIKAEGAWVDRSVEFMADQGCGAVVLPTTVPAPELVAELEARLQAASLQTIKVRSAALAEARQPLLNPPLRLSPTVASAVVLGRRALDPLKEWSAVDPVAIGVAEYQADLDEDQLRAALTETAELCRLERRRGKRVYMGGAVPRGSAAMARLNPLVKSLADLRAGMTVYGVVTNISHFGAFVNIGLPQEALVHISELSDRFVSNPNEVVSIGQQVTAHVLAVDPGRGRISLSLKTQQPPSKREERVGDGAPRPRPGVGNEKMSKAQALANLEKLFKKL
jgi:predicted RNA-binding protein with RPS1 domain